MKVYTLDIDSSERDPILYPNQNEYVIDLKNQLIYDVTKITLVSAKIPNSQLLINSTNNTFSIDNTDFTLANTNYSSGSDLASDLELLVAPPASKIDSVSYDADTNSITFSNTVSDNFSIRFYSGTNGYVSREIGKTTPHQILGFTSLDYDSDAGQLKSGSINLTGPNDLIIRISSGSDHLNKHVYSNTPFYTGRIITNGTTSTIHTGSDDPLNHTFYAGQQKTIRRLKVEFFYMSHGRLIPYDFRNQDHIIKLEIECSTDKLEGLPKVMKSFELPPPISIPEIENPYKWKEYMYIATIVVVGTLLLMLMRPRKLSE